MPPKQKLWHFSSKRIKPVHPSLYLALRPIEEVISHDHLGVTLSCDLSWRPHILKIHQKASKRLNMLKGLKFKLNRFALEVLYKSIVRSTMEYADVTILVCLSLVLKGLKSLSFIPTIKLWNNLLDKTRQCLSLASFKKQLLNDSFRISPRNYLFYVGDRYPSILHTRLRLGNSALSAHLFLRGCILSPLCICGKIKRNCWALSFVLSPICCSAWYVVYLCCSESWR